MKIIAHNISNTIRIKRSMCRIIERCNYELVDQIKNTSFIITDEIKAIKIYDDSPESIFKRAYIDGFGGVKSGVIYRTNKCHLVVLNISKIDDLDLSDLEFDGVISHELGHIFNEYPPRQLPKFTGNNLEAISDREHIKKDNLKYSEFYADYFSKITQSSDGLIGSIVKYINSVHGKNIELFNERLELLRGKNELVGRIKQIEE